MSVLGIIGPFFTDQTTTRDTYLNLLQESVLERVKELFDDNEVYFQLYEAPSYNLPRCSFSEQLDWGKMKC